MFRLIWLVICTFVFVGTLSHDARAWLWNETSLVTINGENFSAHDFRDWWQHWQEKDMAFPETPDEFVDWQLMAQEGARMQLDSEPSYQRKVHTFLKVRSLMMLKNEEVDSKIRPRLTRESMWSIYEKEYCPRWEIEVFFFATEALAAEKAKGLREGTISFEELNALSAKEGGPLYHESKWLRYPRVKEDWISALKGRKPGFITPPQAMGDKFIILHFLAEKGPEDEDFGEVEGGIRSKLADRISAELTSKLFESLQKKYEVVVDEGVLATIGKEALDFESSEKAVVTTSQGNISAGALQALLAKERTFRKKFSFTPEEMHTLKKRVVNNMLAQTLISWESMNRHYEKKEPFSFVYQFYRKHRLTKEIEKRFIRPKAKLDDGEAKAYYIDNQQKYAQSKIISYALAEGEEDLIKRMRQEVIAGADFMAVAAKHFPGGLPVQHVPEDHLGAELKGPLLSLHKGEVSPPFTSNNNFAMVKLVNRKSANPVPFRQVKDEIQKELSAKKFAASRKEFLDLLKEKSVIEINMKTWNKLHKELEQQYESKKNK